MDSLTSSRAHFLALCIALLLAGCGGGSSPSPAKLAQSLSSSIETANYIFRYSPGDSVDSSRQEKYFTWAIATLGVQPTQKVNYYKYLDRNQMQSLTGQATNGWADPANYAVHSIWSWDNHEVIHVYTAAIGRPSDYFNEGIAVAMETDPSSNDLVPRWSGTPLHTLARNMMSSGRLSAVTSMCETSTFRAVSDDNSSYPEAGSFVEFLIEQYGMTRVQTFFRISSRDDSLPTITSKFQQAFGVSISDADSAWRSFLAKQ